MAKYEPITKTLHFYCTDSSSLENIKDIFRRLHDQGVYVITNIRETQAERMPYGLENGRIYSILAADVDKGTARTFERLVNIADANNSYVARGRSILTWHDKRR